MRKILIFAVVAASLAVAGLLGGCGTTETVTAPTDTNPFAAGKVGTDSTLEVMTWNIEHFAKAGNVTADYVIEAVEGLQVDIIALQEIENATYFNRVREGLKDWTGDRATSAGYQINLAFLYPVHGPVQVTSVYEILTEYREYPGPLPRSPFVLEGSFNGTEFVVINNHYKCCGDNVLEDGNRYDEEVRRRDASLLIDDFIRTNFPDRAVIVVGDMNDSLTDFPAVNVFQNFIEAPDKYRFADMAIAQGNSVWSYPSWHSHLDHILITSQLFDAQQRSDALIQVAPLNTLLGPALYDKKVSDHLPVVLRVKP